MSHVVSLDIKVLSLTALRKAAEAVGLEFREGQKTHRWYGKWVQDYNQDDAAYKHGIDPKEYGKCDHALGIPNNDKAYEVGVRALAEGGYALLWDLWLGGHGLQERIGEQGCKLMQEYTRYATLEVLQQQGLMLESVQEVDGEIVMQVHVER